MKRFVAFLLIFMLSFSVLTACTPAVEPDEGGTTADTRTSVEGSTEGSVISDVTSTAADADTGVSASAAEAGTSSDTEEKILADTDEFTIIITDCVTDSTTGFTMNAYLVNKTENPIEFRVTASALNNKDMHPAFTQEVKPGESLAAPMNWSADKLSERRVTEVTEVKIELEVVSYGEEVKLISSEIYVITP